MRKTIIILFVGFFMSTGLLAQVNDVLNGIGKKDLSKLEESHE